MLREASDADAKPKRRKGEAGEASDTTLAHSNGAGSDEESRSSDSAASSAEEAQRLL